MSRNLWTFLSFTFHSLKHFLELFLAEFSVLNNGIWSLEEEGLGTLELFETWTSDRRMAMAHRLSALFRVRPSVFYSPWWLLPGSASEEFLGCIHWTSQEQVPAACSRSLLQRLPWPMHLDYVQGKSGWREGRREGCWPPASCPCVRLGDSQSVYQPQELKSSEVIFWIVSSNIFASSYIKWIRKLEKVGGRASY